MPVQIPDYTSPYLTGTSGTTGPGAASRSALAAPASGPSGSGTPGIGSNNSRTKSTGNSTNTRNTTDTSQTDETDGTSGSGGAIDAVFGDASDKMVSMDDFLTLMVAQLKNQDFMNPVDDTQYVTQLAQISTMQQMEEMAYNAKSTYVASLVGKNVSAAKFTVSGDLKKTDGVVDKISLLDGKFVIYVDGEAYDMDEIMEIKAQSSAETGGGEGGNDEGDDSKNAPNNDTTKPSDV